MRLASGGWRHVKRVSYLLCLTLLVGGQLSPVVYKKAEGIEYLVIFDVTLSMATEDYMESGLPKSRLDVAKDVFRKVLPALPDESRVTLAGFAGNNVQVFLISRPVRDVAAIEAGLSVLEWDNVWEVGSRIDMALRDVAAQAIGGRVFSFGGRRRILPSPLNVIFITDGGENDVAHSVLGDATGWLLQNARLTFVGVGQPWPSPVPEFKRTYPRDCLRDEAGRCLTSRLNERNLQALAEWLKGRYERLGDAAQLEELIRDAPLTGAETEVAQEIGWLFTLGSLAFFFLWLVL